MINDIVPIIFAITLLFTLLISFILISYFRYRRKQVINAAERDNMMLNFQKELLISEIEVRERTLQTIGADLHDNVGQLLSLISITLKSISDDHPENITRKINDAIDLTGRSIKELRQLGKLIQGEQLISQGLDKAIMQEVGWIERSGQFEVRVVLEEIDGDRINREKDLILFRMFQEIINNIIKHSGGDRIDIRLKDDGHILTLEISDNGKGLLNGTTFGSDGFGLKTIYKRASFIGADINSWPAPGGGLGYTIDILYP